MKTFLRTYPVAIVVTLVMAGGLFGTIVYGPSFITRPWPVPPLLAGAWMAFNLCLAVIAFAFIYRNLYRHINDLTWQELGGARGTLLLLFAGFLGYLGRAFTEPSITMGTAVYTVAALTLIWSTVRPPERFEGNHDGSPR